MSFELDGNASVESVPSIVPSIHRCSRFDRCSRSIYIMVVRVRQPRFCAKKRVQCVIVANTHEVNRMGQPQLDARQTLHIELVETLEKWRVPQADVEVLDEVMGLGSMGIVYAATFGGAAGSRVAVKMINDTVDVEQRSAVLDDMRREMLVATKLPWCVSSVTLP